MPERPFTEPSGLRRRLHERLAVGRILVVPGAYDALLARLIERAGFEAVYLTGSGVSYSTLAQPDIGLVTADRMADKVRELVAAVSVPIVADADTGYGDSANITRTVEEFERLGAAAIQIEDQAFPKRCGHYTGKQLVSIEEMTERINVALMARRDADFAIIARTDARADLGIDEALKRARNYADAGADLIFVEAPTSLEELEQIPPSVPVPTIANMVEGGRTPIVAASRLESMGFAVVIYPNALTRSIVFTAQNLLENLRTHGSTELYRDRMVKFKELVEIVGGDATMISGL